MRKIIKISEIEREFYGCPYCGDEKESESMGGCCGESSAHYCEHIETTEGDVYTMDEVEIIPERKVDGNVYYIA